MAERGIVVRRGARELVCPARRVGSRDLATPGDASGRDDARPPRGILYIEPGLGLAADSWTRTVRALLALPAMRDWLIVTCNRAGYGESTPDADPRSLDEVLADQAAILSRLRRIGGPETPLILAGHSWGGTLLRLWIAAHPGLATGLVLVDASYEGGHEHYSDGLVGDMREGAERVALEIAEWFHVISPRGRENAAHARVQEIEVFQESLDRLQAEDRKVGTGGTEVTGSTILVTTRKQAGAQLAVQQAFAREVGALVIASDTRSHMIPGKDPRTVARAIGQIATAIGDGAPLA